MFFILFFVSTWIYDILVNGSYIHEEYFSYINGLNNIYNIINRNNNINRINNRTNLNNRNIDTQNNNRRINFTNGNNVSGMIEILSYNNDGPFNTVNNIGVAKDVSLSFKKDVSSIKLIINTKIKKITEIKNNFFENFLNRYFLYVLIKI